MPPPDFTSSEKVVFVKKTELPCLLSPTPREHLLKNPTLPLKNGSTVSQKLRNASKLKEMHGTMSF
jgi:hypothetical protein